MNEQLYQKYFQILHRSMLQVDSFNYDKSILEDFARHGAFLKEGLCSDMPEDIFCNYVLSYRVNKEMLEPHRSFFYELLKHLISDNTYDTVMNVNRWCAANVSYRSTDERTLSAKTVYLSGFGRCGEESVLLVSALRSVGVACRQVYVPWWSHCDDNHAWVEVWDNGEWHYVGACEPAAIWDTGWFNNAAKRAVLVRSTALLIDKDIPNHIQNEVGISYHNETHRYTECDELLLKLCYNKKILSNVDISLNVVNYAELKEIASLTANEKGEASISIGRGDVLLSCFYDSMEFLVYLNTDIIQSRAGERMLIDLADYKADNKRLLFKAPVSIKSDREYMPEAIEKTERCLKSDEAFEYLSENNITGLWNILNEKDRRDVSVDVLKDVLENAVRRKFVDEHTYLEYVLNPRVKNEVLRACRGSISELYYRHFGVDIKNESIEVLLGNIRLMLEDFDRILESEVLHLFADAVAANGTYGNHSEKIFIINILRAAGIPSFLKGDEAVFLDEELNARYYNDADVFKIKIKSQYDISDNEFSLYYRAFDESSGRYETRLKKADCVKNGEGYETDLPKCIIRSVTASRLPNGNVYTYIDYYKSDENGITDINGDKVQEDGIIYLEKYEPDIKELTISCEMPDELKKHCKNGLSDRNIIILAQDKTEPTEHIFNELLDMPEKSEAYSIFIMNNNPQPQSHAIRRFLEGHGRVYMLPYNEFYYELLGRAVFVNHEDKPIVALFDNNYEICYAAAGYNPGNVELMFKISDAIGGQNGL